jgi:tRNA threonylcarbamoyladenosine biosynthesis protein TsaB
MILALKTDGAISELRVLEYSGAVRQARTWDSGRALAADLLAQIQGLLTDCEAAVSNLTGIIIYSGPGSFTSLRIGHSVANALADSLAIPVVGAAGPGWLDRGRKALDDAPPGRPALPAYGAEAHITKPKP